MKKDSDRIELLVSEKRVKLHLFEPSQRKIWTVVGTGEEYWIDLDGHGHAASRLGDGGRRWKSIQGGSHLFHPVYA